VAEDVGKLRKRIEKAKADLARTEGEQGALLKQIEAEKEALRETLDCEPGEEKEAITALRKKIKADEVDLEELLDEAEKLAQGDPE